jgi:hypothetical protein
MKSFKTHLAEGRPSQRQIDEQKSAKSGVVETDVFGIKAYHSKCLEPGCKFESKRFSSMKKAQEAAKKHAEKEHFVKEEIEQVDERCWPGYKETPGKKAYDKGSCTKEEVEQIDELSTELLGRYKKAAGASASAADKAGDFEKGNKRFAGINKATLKQFKNAVKKEEVKLDEAIPKSTMYAVVHSSSKKIIAKGNKKDMLKKVKALNAKEKRSHFLGDSPSSKVGDTFGEEIKYIGEAKVDEDWQKVNKADRTDGLSQKAVDAYRRENPGSKLQTAVTEKNPKGKRAARRKSFCSRMSGMKKRLTNPENARDPDSPINKALRRWNC